MAAAGAALRARHPSDVDRDYTVPALQLTEEIEKAPSLLMGTRTVHFEWIPGHMKCEGNEKADLLAKIGAESEPPADAIPSPAWIGREARNWKDHATEMWWRAEAPQRYLEWEIPWKKKPPELNCERAWLATIIAARTQHGDFAAYHERFIHQDGPWLCRCGREKKWNHIFFCREAKNIWNQSRRKPPPWIKPRRSFRDMFCEPKGWQALQDYAKATGFYTQLSPMGFSPRYRGNTHLNLSPQH